MAITFFRAHGELRSRGDTAAERVTFGPAADSSHHSCNGKAAKGRACTHPFLGMHLAIHCSQRSAVVAFKMDACHSLTI